MSLADTFSAPSGPEWLQDRRALAADRFAAATKPTTDEEVWRYSRVGDLDLTDFTPAAPVGADGSATVIERVRARVDALVPDRAGLLVVVDGSVVHGELTAEAADRGVVLADAASVPSGPDVLGAVVGAPGDYFGALNDAYAPAPALLDVPRGVTLEHPVVVVQLTASDDVVALPRLAVRIGSGAVATVVDLQISEPVRALSIPVVELDVADGAQLTYLSVQDLAATVWQVGHQSSRVGQQGRLVSATAALGGGYARLRTDCALVGRGASGDLVAAYFGDGDQTLDFRTFQDHGAPDTTSNLLFKGVVDDHARSVYTGLIRVRPEGRGTNAFQANRTIKLSDDAWAESVPNLEIENNDVHCSHASAVGPIDELQHFYLESRGVPPGVADRLIVAGFFSEVLAQIPVHGVAAAVRDRVAAKLGEVAS